MGNFSLNQGFYDCQGRIAIDLALGTKPVMVEMQSAVISHCYQLGSTAVPSSSWDIKGVPR